ncbi:hypothetical protein B0H11DRAFT_2264342 [Mycena galericulata]|nr:hypothetical protein B0H11DRAFT_2264342 [Mycena galericulata]
MRTQASRVDLLLSRHAEGWNVLPAATVAGAATGGAPAGVEEEEWDEAELELDWEVDEEMPTHLQNGKSRHPVDSAVGECPARAHLVVVVRKALVVEGEEDLIAVMATSFSSNDGAHVELDELKAQDAIWMRE